MEMVGFEPTTPCFTRQITKYLIKLHYLFIVTEAGVEPTPIVVRLSLFRNLKALRLLSKLPCDDSSFAGIRTSTIRIKILCATFTLRRSNNFQGRARTFNSPQHRAAALPIGIQGKFQFTLCLASYIYIMQIYSRMLAIIQFDSGRARTANIQLRRLLFYPAELRNHNTVSAGFEPADSLTEVAGLANRCLKPLGQLTKKIWPCES